MLDWCLLSCICKPGSNVSAYTLYRMKVRGHSIFWDVEKNVPDWVKALSRSKLLPALNTHLDYMINLARGKSVTFHSLLIISLTPRLYGPHGQPCQGQVSHFSLHISYLPCSTIVLTTWANWTRALWSLSTTCVVLSFVQINKGD